MLSDEITHTFNRVNVFAGMHKASVEDHIVMTQRMLQLLQEHFDGKDWTDKLEFKRFYEQLTAVEDHRGLRVTIMNRALEYICIKSTLYTRAPGEMPYLVYSAMKGAHLLGVPIELLVTTALLLYPVTPVP